MKYGFGVDLGGTTVKLAYFDSTGNLLYKWEIPTVTAGEGRQILPDIADAIEGYLAKNRIDREDILGIGIGVPGPVLPDGRVNQCINLGWGVMDIQTELSALTGFPVKAGNDATVAALGEAWKGGGQGCENMVLVTLGTGVGGGIVIGGKALCGSHGAGGEIGHMTLHREETTPCNCGKCGCVEQYCSATGIVNRVKAFLQKPHEASALDDIRELTCKDIFDAAADGDGTALALLEDIYDDMGLFLANLCCVTDPEVIVLGGGVSKAGAPLLEGVRRHFAKYAFHGCRQVKLSLACLGNDAGAYGAFKLILGD